MSHSSGGQGQKVRDLEMVLAEWNENFGADKEEGTQGVFGIVPMTPTALRHQLTAQREQIKALEATLQEMSATKDKGTAQVKDLMATHSEAARFQAEADRDRHQKALRGMRERCDEDVAIAAEEARRAREEAKAAME